jgi:signal transduction histidine kinase
MRTKLFLAFIAVMLVALVSNFIFEHLIIRDFDEYVYSSQEDRLYWVLASVEGSYVPEQGWDMESLWNAMHWAVMLGFDIEVVDIEGNTVLTSAEVVNTLGDSMLRRMESIVELTPSGGEGEPYPLFVEGEELGTLVVNRLEYKGFLREKEDIFKKRGRDFLLISFLIAGGGALFLSMGFSLFLSRPARRLQRAAESVAAGDLSVRVPGSGSADEIGRLTRAFNHMVESLEREEALRSHLTSNVAHELRTPLAILKANLEAVADGVMECKPETLEGLASEVERLISLVRGIEDFTKAEASFFKPAEYERVELKNFVENVLQGFRPLFDEKGLVLTLEVGEPFTVDADIEKLDIVLRNLLSNALRHTQQGCVSVVIGKDKARFFIEVADTGSGMSPEEQKNIFKRFYKGNESSGVGLGLAITLELVDIMGGAITVESRTGEGSIFRVELPLDHG